MTAGSVLVVDDERPILMTLEVLLTRVGFRVFQAGTGRLGRELVFREKPDVVLLDLGLPDMDGMDLLREIKEEHPDIQVIILTGQDSLHNAIESIKLGAFHFISKPYAQEELLSLLARATEAREMRAEARSLRVQTVELKKQLDRAEQILIPKLRSRRMQEIYDLVRLLGGSDASVLLLGESGVGKEVIANQIHASSARSGCTMIKLNCAALPANMIEAELFGYVKGAFTGALTDFPGMIQAARGGTLFLDEVGEMPPELQTRLLRVLQERELRPLGSTRIVQVDFRLITATNRAIDEALESGSLREDLYYRINTFQIEIPPLRERREDVPGLVATFLELFNVKAGITPDALEKLSGFQWPGNVRQLRNSIEYAAVLAGGGAIEIRHLPQEIRSPGQTHSGRRKSHATAGLTLMEQEKNAIISALAQSHGNKKRAAELLGIYRPTLYQKMRRLGIQSQ